MKIKHYNWQNRKTQVYPFWAYYILLVFIKYNWYGRLVEWNIIDYRSWKSQTLYFCSDEFLFGYKNELLAFSNILRVPISLLDFLWVGIFLLVFYHVKTMGCLVTTLMSADVIASSYHINVVKVFWGVFLYILSVFSLGFWKLYIAFNVFCFYLPSKS